MTRLEMYKNYLAARGGSASNNNRLLKAQFGNRYNVFTRMANAAKKLNAKTKSEMREMLKNSGLDNYNSEIVIKSFSGATSK
jgi:hypothetical protein